MLFTTGWFLGRPAPLRRGQPLAHGGPAGMVPPARTDGLGQVMGPPRRHHTWSPPAHSTVALALLMSGTVALPLTIVVLVVTALWSATARARLGGQTGDIPGRRPAPDRNRSPAPLVVTNAPEGPQICLTGICTRNPSSASVTFSWQVSRDRTGSGS